MSATDSQRQQTIRRRVSIEGVGLHSGEPIKLDLSPAGADTGIVFRAPDGTLIPATAANVVDGRFATAVGAYGARVRTIEHLMAAAAGLGIDNLLAEVSGDELPGLDGSAMPFVDLLESAGTLTLGARRRALQVDTPVRVDDGSRWIHVFPSDRLRISYTLDHEHPAIGLQAVTFDVTPEVFARDIAPARTYGFLKDVGAMRKNGLARGGSLDNTVVLGTRSVLNPTLRFPDECVRHKALDLLGDLLLLGRPLVGHVVARNGGHSLNHQLVAAIEKAHRGARARRLAQRAASLLAPATTPSGAGLSASSGLAAL
jgi:UDP-3-O-[3-hydroxymyristoyl] N-acetylglucosamine deacetylase